ncbi:helix-turn-helix domain-containing protein [Actinomadura sp. 3N407]|uniref:helix-turn-helix domain-containing protein n=1 Tax=Actinomadura sp. 3N407 TaxID=3457423 RepID=UPI003FCC7C0F
MAVSVMESRVSTEEVPPDDRIAYWEEYNARALVGLTCSSYAEGGLLAQQTNLRVGGLRLADIQGNEHVIERTPRTCRDLPKESVFASLVLQGEAVFYHSGGCLTINAGNLILYDTARPYLFGFSTPMRKLLLDIPREMFAERFRSPFLPAPIALSTDHDSPASRALRSLLLGLAKERGPDGADDLALELLGKLATERVGDRPASPTRLLHLVVAKDYIERHLHDHGLSSGRIAAALGISVRHLSRVFEPEGLTPARYVMQRRLTKAKEDLADPTASHTTVAEIAHRHGFADQAHFTRVFRERFGCTPGAARPA